MSFLDHRLYGVAWMSRSTAAALLIFCLLITSFSPADRCFCVGARLLQAESGSSHQSSAMAGMWRVRLSGNWYKLQQELIDFGCFPRGCAASPSRPKPGDEDVEAGTAVGNQKSSSSPHPHRLTIHYNKDDDDDERLGKVLLERPRERRSGIRSSLQRGRRSEHHPIPAGREMLLLNQLPKKSTPDSGPNPPHN